ncbi:unnamed protein product [Heterobilharzia americana]|nr:unnamed protein product [Heterobilharzia americana]
MNGHMIMSTNQKQIYSNKPCQQECSSSIVSGTRESLTSGNGYFTGDDDCGSVGGSSGRVVKFSIHSTDLNDDDDDNHDRTKQKPSDPPVNKQLTPPIVINYYDESNTIEPH